MELRIHNCLQLFQLINVQNIVKTAGNKIDYIFVYYLSNAVLFMMFSHNVNFNLFYVPNNNITRYVSKSVRT
uniref:Uncharacterized protein n=1 Tax=Lepeophtheirus salmonis TaxID=72036 RepID=A0A0K2VB59_LEPSM